MKMEVFMPAVVSMMVSFVGVTACVQGNPEQAGMHVFHIDDSVNPQLDSLITIALQRKNRDRSLENKALNLRSALDWGRWCQEEIGGGVTNCWKSLLLLASDQEVVDAFWHLHRNGIAVAPSWELIEEPISMSGAGDILLNVKLEESDVRMIREFLGLERF